MENAGELEKRLTADGRFELLNDARYLPVVVVRPTGKSSPQAQAADGRQRRIC